MFFELVITGMNDTGREFLEKILIVDDDEDDYLLALEVFKEAGLKNEILWLKDGDELMDLLGSKNSDGHSVYPCLILLDLNMPKKDGREVLLEIKEDPILRIIPTIIFSTSKAEVDIQFTYERGGNSYIQKPVQFQDFVHVIEVFTDYWLNTVTLPYR